ncbi:hypothetical protein [Homoserinibacter sp. GY 40078]|uniref:hypothetical protein n=1 Tax=Homoserinibacter sp. GY 40078 TaxID=2603275 RepID=UPI0011CB8D3E|nr:hypothetical protein [Homoserinibacter sp. GY 40078]TXK16309.1 hypothetical protein FVQ89_13720 [Homoserinibacter sp. GY 40078]
MACNRLWRSASAAVLASIALAGCTATTTPEPEQPSNSARSGPENCLGPVSYPELRVWDLNESLPVRDVGIEHTQWEVAIPRGEGCVDVPQVQVRSQPCPVVKGPGDEIAEILLGSPRDGVTRSEFARGSVGTVTELVTGYASGGEWFTYRMSAWRYESEALAAESRILAMVAACVDSVDEEVRGVPRAAVYEGDEPHRVAFRVDETVYLIESLRTLDDGGAEAQIVDTASGLLPASAIGEIQDWWIPRGAEVLAELDTTAAASGA